MFASAVWVGSGPRGRRSEAGVMSASQASAGAVRKPRRRVATGTGSAGELVADDESEPAGRVRAGAAIPALPFDSCCPDVQPGCRPATRPPESIHPLPEGICSVVAWSTSAPRAASPSQKEPARPGRGLHRVTPAVERVRRPRLSGGADRVGSWEVDVLRRGGVGEECLDLRRGHGMGVEEALRAGTTDGDDLVALGP